MNRLVLIGNGFDLAHQMKTGYNDFMLWYLYECLNVAHINGEYNDDLLEIKCTYPNDPIRIGEIKDVRGLIDYYYEKGFNELLSKREIRIPGYSNIYLNPFIIKPKSKLIEQLIIICSCTSWVEIENEFYEELKAVLVLAKEERKAKLDRVNATLAAIIAQLEAYLGTMKLRQYHKGYIDILKSPVFKDEVVTVSMAKDVLPDKTLVLNFNYTSTIEGYIEGIGSGLELDNIDVNYIHGKLGDISNPLIFGFGDELDSEYTKMELEKTKGFFEYIKSFWYFKTSNYHDLIRFVELDDFQVYTLGHSCGLSDRTMLNMIFEHSNCKSIKLFYYQNKTGYNNFKELTHEVSRHFKNKVEMRRKIVSFNKSNSMPQLGDGNECTDSLKP